MAKTVFILGAGASVEAGAPLMNNFLDKTQDLLTSGRFSENPEEKRELESVFSLISKLESIHSRAPIDLNNIESLFGLIEMGNIINKIGDLDTKSIPGYRKSLIKLITRTIEESMMFDTSNMRFNSHPSYFIFCNYLNRHIDNNNLASILTFNYDLGIDVALENTFGKIDYCLEPSELNGFKLMKLHGSINWVFENDKIIPVSKVLVNDQKYIRMSHEIMRNNGVDKLPVIVPPTWNKSQYHGQLSNVWNSAANELNSADYLVIIGFSLPETDTFFKYLLGLGLMNGNRIRQIVVINKDNSTELKDRYNRLFGYGISSRVKFVAKTFSESIYYLETDNEVEYFNLHQPFPSNILGRRN